jgi:hypothetical protein
MPHLPCPVRRSDIRQSQHRDAAAPYSAASGAIVSVFHGRSGDNRMDVHIRMVMLQPIVALIAGVLILLMPRLLNYIVAIYLIIIGLTGLWPHLMH